MYLALQQLGGGMFDAPGPFAGFLDAIIYHFIHAGKWGSEKAG